jgi:CRISPR-associated protein Cas1
MFNCILNYLNGILYSKVEKALITAGIDPYIGIMHRNEYNRPVLAFDIIEKYRIWAEQVVIQLCFRQIPDEEMFSYQQNGYWLQGPGKKIIITAFDLYMDEVVNFDSRRMSRYNHIDSFAQYLATRLKNFQPADDKEPY